MRLDAGSIGSLEYAVAVLARLHPGVGHSKCGAVDAAVKSVKDGKEFPGHIPSLVSAIRPAVKAARISSVIARQCY